MKRCILHLGMPKTASTSIQTALWDNRDMLKKYGWIYPQFTCPQHGHVFFLHNDPLCRLFFPESPFYVQRAVKNGVIDLDIQREGLFEQLDEYCQNTSKLIISSEALLKILSLKKIQHYLSSRGFSIEPIVYVRSPCSYRVSMYQSILKSSLMSRSLIVENLQLPAVWRNVKAALDVFGDSVRLYPFNHLKHSGEDVVQHFFSHVIGEKECRDIQFKNKNTSLSWQATDLLDYIEEESPLYVENILNKGRRPGDINPLHKIAGERFKFTSKQMEIFREVTDIENDRLRSNLGQEFCDRDESSLVATGPLVWGEESAQSLLNVISKVPVYLKHLIYDYLRKKAVFSSPDLRRSTIQIVHEELNKNRQSSVLYNFMKLFPVETRRGNFARKMFDSFKC